MGVRHTETNLIVWSAIVPDESGSQEQVATTNTSEPLTPIFAADALFDAGDKGCAYGPLTEIANHLKGMAAGQTLEIRATDPTVAVDLSAWCRMTGHELVEQRDDRYLVRHK